MKLASTEGITGVEDFLEGPHDTSVLRDFEITLP